MHGVGPMDRILEDIRKELVASWDEHSKNTMQRFFKEKIKVHGVKTAIVGKIAKKFFNEVKRLDKDQIFSLCEGLFGLGNMEESFIACDWSYSIRARYEEEDFARFEGWIQRYVDNWATCDTLCNHTVGAFIEKYPKYASELKKWAESGNPWMRRAAAVSLIIPAKRGEFLDEALEISDILLGDEEDLVQKGYGWLLKEESRIHRKEVFEYVMKNKLEMPRTALRYAIEKMPKELRVEAMKR
jgi:3-methyladenine DNA glycosylase AlkD